MGFILALDVLNIERWFFYAIRTTEYAWQFIMAYCVFCIPYFRSVEAYA